MWVTTHAWNSLELVAQNCCDPVELLLAATHRAWEPRGLKSEERKTRKESSGSQRHHPSLQILAHKKTTKTTTTNQQNLRILLLHFTNYNSESNPFAQTHKSKRRQNKPHQRRQQQQQQQREQQPKTPDSSSALQKRQFWKQPNSANAQIPSQNQTARATETKIESQKDSEILKSALLPSAKAYISRRTFKQETFIQWKLHSSISSTVFIQIELNKFFFSKFFFWDMISINLFTLNILKIIYFSLYTFV